MDQPPRSCAPNNVLTNGHCAIVTQLESCHAGVEDIADNGTIGPRKFFIMLAERKKGNKKKGEREKRRKGKKEKKEKERKIIERKRE